MNTTFFDVSLKFSETLEFTFIYFLETTLALPSILFNKELSTVNKIVIDVNNPAYADKIFCDDVSWRKKTFTHFSKYVCLSPLFNYYKINEA